MAKINSNPEVRFAGFTEDWEEQEPSEVAKFNPKHEIPDVFYYVDLESVVGTEMISYRKEYKISAPSRAQRLAEKGDVFYQTVRPYQKNNLLFVRDDKNFVFSTGYAQLRPAIESSFLFTLIQKDEFVRMVLNNCTGTSYPAINSTVLASIKQYFPKSKDEQKLIGIFFENIDKLIAEHQQKHTKLKSLKQAMLDKMFPKLGQLVPEIRFKGFEGNWEKVCLADLGDFKSNGVDKKISPKEIPVNLLNYMDVYNSRIINSRNCNQLMKVTAKPNQVIENNVLANDVFFTPSSETPEDIGKVMAIEEDLPNTVYSYHLMRFRPKSNVLYSFYPNYGFACELVRKQLILAGQGVQRYVINKPSFEQINILLPTIDEQEKIAIYFKNIDHLIRIHDIQITKLKNIKKAFLAKMFI